MPDAVCPAAFIILIPGFYAELPDDLSDGEFRITGEKCHHARTARIPESDYRSVIRFGDDRVSARHYAELHLPDGRVHFVIHGNHIAVPVDPNGGVGVTAVAQRPVCRINQIAMMLPAYSRKVFRILLPRSASHW